MTASRTDAPGERTRPTGLKQRILEAATEEFARLGYHGSSLRTIAERSQATKPMIYYHYQGKDGLYAAVVRHQLEELEHRLRASIATQGAVIDRLGTFATVYVSGFMTALPGLAVGLRELPTLPAPLFADIAAAHSRRVVAILKQILRDGEAAGCLRLLDVDNCCRAMLGIMHYYIRGAGLDDGAAIAAATSQITDYYAVGLLSRSSSTPRIER